MQKHRLFCRFLLVVAAAYVDEEKYVSIERLQNDYQFGRVELFVFHCYTCERMSRGTYNLSEQQ